MRKYNRALLGFLFALSSAVIIPSQASASNYTVEQMSKMDSILLSYASGVNTAILDSLEKNPQATFPETYEEVMASKATSPDMLLRLSSNSYLVTFMSNSNHVLTSTFEGSKFNLTSEGFELTDLPIMDRDSLAKELNRRTLYSVAGNLITQAYSIAIQNPGYMNGYTTLQNLIDAAMTLDLPKQIALRKVYNTYQIVNLEMKEESIIVSLKDFAPVIKGQGFDLKTFLTETIPADDLYYQVSTSKKLTLLEIGKSIADNANLIAKTINNPSKTSFTSKSNLAMSISQTGKISSDVTITLSKGIYTLSKGKEKVSIYLVKGKNHWVKPIKNGIIAQAITNA